MTKVRAGTAYGCASAGCNYPEGQCMGTCLHRVDSFKFTDNQFIEYTGFTINFVGPEPEEAEIRNGFDQAMKAPIKRPFADQIAAEEVDESDDFSSSRGLGIAMRVALSMVVLCVVLAVVLS